MRRFRSLAQVYGHWPEETASESDGGAQPSASIKSGKSSKSFKSFKVPAIDVIERKDSSASRPGEKQLASFSSRPCNRRLRPSTSTRSRAPHARTQASWLCEAVKLSRNFTEVMPALCDLCGHLSEDNAVVGCSFEC